MKIVLLDSKTLGNDISLDRFKNYGEFITYQTTKKNETIERVKSADIVITNKVIIDREVIDSSNIKLICVAATGMNNIDLEYAKEKNIIIKNVASYSTNSVVELTFAHFFYLNNRIKYFDEYSKERWSDSDIFTHLDKTFFELYNKTWGIIGLGTIGKRVASVAKIFGAKIVYYSTSGKNSNSEFKRVSLEELLKISDIISIHSPLNRETLNLINRDNLHLLKKRTILLNMGRGKIINEKDLADFLDKNSLFVGLDVLSEEPISKNNPLLKIKNSDKLLITPHIAWASREARERLIDKIEENIKEYLENRNP